MAGRLEGLPDRAGALTALYGAPPARADRVFASVATRQSVWPDNGSQRPSRIIGQFDPDALLKPVFDYTPRAQNVVPFDLLKSISVTHRSSVARSITRQYSAREPTASMPPSRNPEPAANVEHCERAKRDG